jgi:hypothetical protein
VVENRTTARQTAISYGSHRQYNIERKLIMEVGRFSPRKENKSRTYCSVYNCSSISFKDLDLRFHLFPKPNECFVNVVNKFGNTEKVDKLQAWIRALKIGKKVSTSMRVCSLHFRKDDYLFPSKYRLKFFMIDTIYVCI